MAVEFKLPKIAEGVESGDVLEILVSVGDTLEIEQEVMELETDKATIFVPSDVEGVITGINCGIGDTIAVGQVILSVEPATAAAAPAPVESAPAAPVAEKPAEAVQEPVAPVAPVQPVAPVPPVAPVVSKPESALVKKSWSPRGRRFDGLLGKSALICKRFKGPVNMVALFAKTF